MYEYDNTEIRYERVRDPREMNVVENIKYLDKVKDNIIECNDDPVSMDAIRRVVSSVTAELKSPTELVLQSEGGKKFVVTISDEGDMTSTPAIQSMEDLKAAINKGGIIVLTEDFIISEQLIIPKDVDVTLCLRDCNITMNYEENYAIVAKGNLTINGKGTINVTGYGFSTSYSTPGTITINGGTYNAIGCDYLFGCFGGNITFNEGTFNGEYCVINNFCGYYKKEGSVVINGGTLSAEYPVLGEDGAEVTINGGSIIQR